ncbi:MAG: HAD-IA family hydrolase [Bacteroidaceae bacterium]|nr:HAD-IA family hydrolase [Bacteroidaceae bacterium]
MNNYSTIIFDLDGTLLDTLQDLHTAVNYALAAHHFPQRSLAEVRSFLGNGVGYLVQKCLPEDTSAEVYEQVLETFRPYYFAHSMDQTKPYDGVLDAIAALKAKGKRMGIVSNKPDEAVQDLHKLYFAPAGVDVAVGESPSVRRKPDPAGVFAAIARLGAEPSEAVYVGDSEVDLETARRAGLPCIAVAWGFRDVDFLSQAGAGTIISHPRELLQLL